MTALATQADNYDDIEVAGSGYIYGVDVATLDDIGRKLDRARSSLANCDKALGSIVAATPNFVPHENHWVLPHGGPHATWTRLTDAVSYARVGAGGLADVRVQLDDVHDAVLLTKENYATAEKDIIKRFEAGRKVGNRVFAHLLSTVAQWGAAKLDIDVPLFLVDELGDQAYFAMAAPLGDYGALIERGARTIIPLYGAYKFFTTDETTRITNELANIIAQRSGVQSSPEEFVAAMYGVYSGVDDPKAFSSLLSQLGLHTLMMSLFMKPALKKAARDDVQAFTVVQEKQISAAAPESLSDVYGLIGEAYRAGTEEESAFVIQTIDGDPTVEGGEDQAVRVYIPGMQHVGEHETHPNDAVGNMRAVQGKPTVQSEAVKEALFAMNLPRGTKISFVGHSKGAMDARNLAADPEINEYFDVQSVETAGGPDDHLEIEDTKIIGSKDREMNPKVHYTSIHHSQDIVPGTDMHAPRSGENFTNVRASVVPVLEEGEGVTYSNAHSIENYAKTAKRLEEMGLPEYLEWEQAAASTLAPAGSDRSSTLHVFKVAKVTEDN